MLEKSEISSVIPDLPPDLVSDITEVAIKKDLPENTIILKEGQYVKVIPIVRSGLIKVFSRYEDKDLLLYYIRPGETCVMSFAASLKNEPSRVFAMTEENTVAILLPVDKMARWIRQFPDFNAVFYQQYNVRYSELLDTINHILFNKMDTRLYNYLIEKREVTARNPLQISHRQIASDLGTAREVISRVMKKLEHEGKVKQHSSSIEIL